MPNELARKPLRATFPRGLLGKNFSWMREENFHNAKLSVTPFGGSGDENTAFPGFRSYLALPWAKFPGPSGAKR